jgi:hypothetical protein
MIRRPSLLRGIVVCLGFSIEKVPRHAAGSSGSGRKKRSDEREKKKEKRRRGGALEAR